MAQERKKSRIVIASVLKPVDDTRMFEKMGVSIARSGRYEVFIIGFPSLSKVSFPGIHFIQLKSFPRLSLQRWFAKWQVFAKVWKLKPSILIVNTHELLFPVLWLKVILSTHILYDVRENYFRNILHSGSFPPLVQWPLALLVRFKEKLLAPSIDHFFLAEKAYENELKFHRGSWTVVENKTWIPNTMQERKIEPGKIRLLFSGTLAESTGVFRAIQLSKELHRIEPSICLTIIGYAALRNVQEKIRREIHSCPFINLIGGDRLVPHSEIVDSILNSDAGIISYPVAPHTQNSTPTKLFEYLQCKLPIIQEAHWPWVQRYEKYQPFIFFDFSKGNPAKLLNDLKTKSFYPTTPQDVSWESEEGKLLKALEDL